MDGGMHCLREPFDKLGACWVFSSTQGTAQHHKARTAVVFSKSSLFILPSYSIKVLMDTNIS